MPYPWLVAELPAMPEAWAEAFGAAMAQVARLHLPPKFRVTRVYENLGTLRFDFIQAGAAEAEVDAIRLHLAIRTDAWCQEPEEPM